MPAPADNHALRAALRGLVAFLLVLSVLWVAAWFLVPALAPAQEGGPDEWGLLGVRAVLVLVAAVAGWIEYRRARRER